MGLFLPSGQRQGGVYGGPPQMGDVIPCNYISQNLTTVGAGTLTAALIAGGVVRRTGPAGGFIDTTDTGNNIWLALGSPPAGSAYEFTYVNGVAFAMTFTPAFGVVTVGTVNVAASVIRRYLVTVECDQPQATVLMNTTNASPTLQLVNLADVKNVAVGQAVSGVGIGAAPNLITAVNAATGAITVSVNSTANGTNIAVTASPVISFEGLFAGTA